MRERVKGLYGKRYGDEANNIIEIMCINTYGIYYIIYRHKHERRDASIGSEMITTRPDI